MPKVSNLDRTLTALAEPTRRRVVDELKHGPRSAGELAAAVGMGGPALSRHLRLLRQTGLVEAESAESDARVRMYRLRPEPFVPLRAWLDQVEAYWTDQLNAFRDHVEQRSKDEVR